MALNDRYGEGRSSCAGGHLGAPGGVPLRHYKGTLPALRLTLSPNFCFFREDCTSQDDQRPIPGVQRVAALANIMQQGSYQQIGLRFALLNQPAANINAVHLLARLELLEQPHLGDGEQRARQRQVFRSWPGKHGVPELADPVSNTHAIYPTSKLKRAFNGGPRIEPSKFNPIMGPITATTSKMIGPKGRIVSIKVEMGGGMK